MPEAWRPIRPVCSSSTQTDQHCAETQCVAATIILSVPIKRSQRLRDAEKDSIGFSIPRPLNARLDALVERANEQGENTTRTELVAALLLDASDSGSALSKLVRRYRSATADDVVIEGEEQSRFLDPPPARPGPRARKSS